MSPRLVRFFGVVRPSFNAQVSHSGRFVQVRNIAALPDSLHPSSSLKDLLLKDRIIWLSGQIDDFMSTSICGQLLYLEAQDSKAPVSLYINSPGGSVTSGLAIYDTIRYIACEVNTLCIGQASSMAAILLAAGNQRLMTPNSFAMVHQPSGGVTGTAADMYIHATWIVNTRQRLNQILQHHINDARGKKNQELLSEEYIAALVERDTYIDSKRALEIGLIDKIIVSRGDQLPDTSLAGHS